MKIFLIDDEYINNIISTKILNKISTSLNIVKYTNPMLAYTEMEKEKPDLILLDLNMPTMSGWQFLDEMRDERLAFQVVVLTSSVCKPDYSRALSYSNVIGYAEKPLNRDEISKYIITNTASAQ